MYELFEATAIHEIYASVTKKRFPNIMLIIEIKDIKRGMNRVQYCTFSLFYPFLALYCLNCSWLTIFYNADMSC